MCNLRKRNVMRVAGALSSLSLKAASQNWFPFHLAQHDPSSYDGPLQQGTEPFQIYAFSCPYVELRSRGGHGVDAFECVAPFPWGWGVGPSCRCQSDLIEYYGLFLVHGSMTESFESIPCQMLSSPLVKKEKKKY